MTQRWNVRAVFSTVAITMALTLSTALAYGDEAVELLDGTKIVGKVVHYFDATLTIRLPNGDEMKLPREKIRRLQFKLPKPRTSFSTPQKTFNRIRKAALRGDISSYIDGHSAYYQMYLSHQVSVTTPQEFRKRLKKEWSNTKLRIMGQKIKKGLATLRVRRLGDSGQEGEFRFIKENGEWKMVLPI